MNDNRRIAAVLVTGLLVILVILIARRPSGQSTTDANSPDGVVWAFFAAQKSGNVGRYLSTLSGEALKVAQQSIRESGRAKFSDYLKQCDRELKGIAVRGKQERGPGSVLVLVDLTFADGQEAQRFLVERQGIGWKITRIEGEQRRRSLIPYGAPVVPLQQNSTSQ
jgi:hypothetical protein